VTSEAELPPLTPAETRVVLRKLGDLTEDIVLVGGQALAFWAERYSSRFVLSGPVNSKDIDFGGHRDAAAIAAAKLGGTCMTAEPFDPSPNSALVEFEDPGGHQRRIDFLRQVFGLDLKEVFDMAIGVDAPDQNETTFFRVMHPVHCLEARISNVAGLPGYQTRLALDQAHASILCAREYLRDRLDEGAIRPVLNLNERIYRFAFYNKHASAVLRDYGLDVFDAVLVDERLPHAFRTKRHPQMRSSLEKRRARQEEVERAAAARRKSQGSSSDGPDQSS
jgi:hypothetical protein